MEVNGILPKICKEHIWKYLCKETEYTYPLLFYFDVRAEIQKKLPKRLRYDGGSTHL
jgi:hypothetical protein